MQPLGTGKYIFLVEEGPSKVSTRMLLFWYCILGIKLRVRITSWEPIHVELKSIDKETIFPGLMAHLGFPSGLVVKRCRRLSNVGRCRRHRFNPWEGKIPWRRARQPTSILPGKSPRQRSLTGCSPWGRKESHMTKANEHEIYDNGKFLKLSWS